MTSSESTFDLIAELSKPLDHERVKQFGSNAGAKAGLSFLEGHDVIRELNTAFGFKWSHYVIGLELVDRYEHKGRNDKPMFTVIYACRVRISVQTDLLQPVIHHEGVGTGSSTMGVYSKADCYEVAMKEAETDALKRAAIKFGDRFGLALYDKEQANVTKPRNFQKEKSELLQKVVKTHKVNTAAAANIIIKAIAEVMPEGMEYVESSPEQAEAISELALTPDFVKGIK